MAPALSRVDTAERHAVKEQHVATDNRRLADHDTHAVIDEEARADRSARVDLDARQEACDLAEQPRHERQAKDVDDVREAMEEESPEGGVERHLEDAQGAIGPQGPPGAAAVNISEAVADLTASPITMTVAGVTRTFAVTGLSQVLLTWGGGHGTATPREGIQLAPLILRGITGDPNDITHLKQWVAAFVDPTPGPGSREPREVQLVLWSSSSMGDPRPRSAYEIKVLATPVAADEGFPDDPGRFGELVLQGEPPELLVLEDLPVPAGASGREFRLNPGPNGRLAALTVSGAGLVLKESAGLKLVLSGVIPAGRAEIRDLRDLVAWSLQEPSWSRSVDVDFPQAPGAGIDDLHLTEVRLFNPVTVSFLPEITLERSGGSGPKK